MSWFDINQALNQIRAFLSKWSATISNLDRTMRPSSVFECFCFIAVADAFSSLGYYVQRRGPSGQIIFKRSIMGTPNMYTYFQVTKDNLTYELRMNQNYCNAQNVFFNLDIAISNQENSLINGRLDSENILTFCECKHYRNFYPSTCANFLGLGRIAMMPRNILWNPNGSFPDYPPPALLVSGSASASVQSMVDLVQTNRYHIRFFDNISPGSGSVTLLSNWISRRV
jgi:hypothetical protein